VFWVIGDVSKGFQLM